MGLNRLRIDSVAELKKQKTAKELQAENEKLSTDLTDTQMALCDVYEQIIALKNATASASGGTTT